MKDFCFSVFLISILLVGTGKAYSWNSGGEESLEYIDLYQDEEEYKPYFVIDSEDPGTTKPEGNDVEDKEIKPKPDVEISEDEDEPTTTENSEPPPNFEFDTQNMDDLFQKVHHALSDFKAQQDKIAKLEEANNRLLLKIDSIEQQVKTNSIILTNVQQKRNESHKNTLQRVLHVFNKIMSVRVLASDIAVALRANSNTSSRNKPIVVKFTNFATKMRVLAASNRLSPTDITVSSDYSELVAQKRAALVPYLKQARAERHSAYILYDKLVVDGVAHTLEELKNEEERKQEEEVDEYMN